MTDTAYKPFVDETRWVKFYNGTGSALGANLVLVPDASNARGGRLPTAGETIKEVLGVTQRATPASAEGDMVSIHGDVAVCTAYGAIAKGSRVYLSTTAAHLGQVVAFTGVKTSGAQMIIGTALDDAADGSTVMVKLQPRRPGEGFQSGTATLAAGTVTVTGVRISGTTCRILVTANTPGGTAG